MLVDEGLKQLQDQQLTYLGTCYWKLFPANTSIVTTTVLAGLGAEAAWAGYAAQLAGPWAASVIIDPRAVSSQVPPITFGNSSGSPQTWYVLALVDTTAGKIIDARNVGPIIIPDGGTYTFVSTISDKEE
jgi:hypothetical protein